MALDQPCAAAELNIDLLASHLQEVRRAERISLFPSVSRDLNFVVDEAVRWAEFELACRAAASKLLQEVRYQETYRNTQKDGPAKKRLLLSLHFQSLERTLTSDEVDAEVAQIIAACGQRCAAQLLA
jgi:phenylalanyl-tRNA synthetase beta chain